MRKILSGLIILMLWGTLASRGQDAPNPFWAPIHVPADYQTIQEAINAAADGDTIIVSPAEYREKINFNGKNITLQSTDPTSETVVAATIINGFGGGCGYTVTFAGTEGTTCVLSGLTITGGYGFQDQRGGGIMGYGCKATIQHNIIKGNTGVTGGGIVGCNGLIQHNTIMNNSAKGYNNLLFIWTKGQGGGLTRCNGVIQFNSVLSNSADNDGGGFFGCGAVIRNNIVKGNSVSRDPRGAAFYECSGTIEHNTIYENTGGSVIESCHGPIQFNTIRNNPNTALYGCNGTIQNNKIYDNTGVAANQCRGIIRNNLIFGKQQGLSNCPGMILGNTLWNSSSNISSCKGIIRNCIIGGSANLSFLDSTRPVNCCIPDWREPPAGNIIADPKFVSPETNDFRLQSDSPCIDAGVNGFWFSFPEWDMDGNARYAGERVDIGCYEFGAGADTDGDLLSDDDEDARQTNPNQIDSDGDGLADGLEIVRGSNPLTQTLPGVVNVTVETSPVKTIQTALASSLAGDEIIVASGVYRENLVFPGRNVILRSAQPETRSCVETTILDGSSYCPVITLNGKETASSVIKGFSITNGYGPLGGGGILGNESKATIEMNIIKSNNAMNQWNPASGGGIYKMQGIVRKNEIIDNAADYGGGLRSCTGGTESNIIRGNSAYMGGGAYQCNNIINNIIDSNKATLKGGGLLNCSGGIWNNTIVGNQSASGGGMNECTATIRNNILWGNTADNGPQMYLSSTPEYCCIQDWDGAGIGNITTNPQFANLATHDFHLQSTSPCVDAGASAPFDADIEGSPRPYDGTASPRGDGSDYDIGAYEFIGEPAPTPTPTPTPINTPTPTATPTPTPDCLIFVPTDQPTIQEAIDAAEDGCVILVSPGNYIGNINFNGKNVVLRSTNPQNRSLVDATVIHSSISGPVITFAGTEETSCVLSGFTICGGFGDLNTGGGGIRGNGTKATIEHNIIKGNSSAEDGAGITNCDGLIQYNTISGNHAQGGYIMITIRVEGRGGGLAWCDGIIQYNSITDNIGEEKGGGLYCCNAAILNNTIASNQVKRDNPQGSGLYECPGEIRNNKILDNRGAFALYRCIGLIQNNIIKNNQAGLYQCSNNIFNNIIANNAGSGMNRCNGTIMNNTIYGNNGYGLDICKGTILNSIIWNNKNGELNQSSAPTYCCILGWTGGGEGNISSDPLFLSTATGNFHLKEESPCVDAGNPAAQYNDSCIPPGLKTERNDMGAYGGLGSCGWPPMTPEIAAKHIIGSAPLSEEDKADADLNGDGHVNVCDIVLMVLKQK